MAIASQKHTEHGIENEAATVCNRALQGACICFLPSKTNQPLKFMGKCIRAIAVSAI